VTALDVIVQRQILDTLRALQQRLGLSIVLVTHDISVVAYLCDDVVVMYAGQVVERGPVREVLARPRHPYTMGLRNAFPDLMSDAMALVPIHGSPPDLRQTLTGCRFAPRCPFVQPACTSGNLDADVTNDHLTVCRRSAEAGTLRTAALDPATWQRSSSFATS
jgi:peptide/nickel transport system ATP-binding protein